MADVYVDDFIGPGKENFLRWCDAVMEFALHQRSIDYIDD